MANILSKTGIVPGGIIQASYVSQSIDAFTGIVPYDLSLNGTFYINGTVNAITGSLTGSLYGTASYALSSSYTNTITNPVSWSLYTTSASYSEGILSDNVPTSQTSSFQPSVIIAGRGTILSGNNTFEVYNSYFNGKALNNNVWVTLTQQPPYPSLNSDYGSTCVVPLTTSGNTLVFSTVNGPALTDLIFDFIITVQQ
jgi:hypothetical protein